VARTGENTTACRILVGNPEGKRPKNKNQIDANYYFIVLLIGSTCFGQYCTHHQELATMMLISSEAGKNAAIIREVVTVQSVSQKIGKFHKLGGEIKYPGPFGPHY